MIGFDADQDCSEVAADAYGKGARFVCRYLKNLSRAEVVALHDAGLAIVLIFETSPTRATAGYMAGAVDGRTAAAQARALGAPDGTAIYAAVDFDGTEAAEPIVMGYLDSFAAALGGYRLGVYANGAVCAIAAQRSYFTWCPDNKWRGSPEWCASGKATIVQDVGDKAGLDLGIDIDSDTAIGGDIGAWLPPAQPAVLDDPVKHAVVLLQAALNAGGAGPKLDEDGILGPHTIAAYKARGT